MRPWPAAAHLSGLPFLLMGLMAPVFGLLLLAGPILPLDREILVDSNRRRVIERRRMRWLDDRVRSTSFQDIKVVAMREDHDTEGADRGQLVLLRHVRQDPLALLTRPLDGRAELWTLAARLRAAVQP